MAENLFINAEFFKRNIPHKQVFDTNQVMSAVRLIQKTNLVSIISVPVYDNFQDKITSGEVFTVAEEKLFETMQLFLAVKVAQELIDTSPSAMADNANESHLSYGNKSTLMEARIIRDINRDEDLLELAQTGTDTFDTEEMSQSGGFYFG